MKEGEGQGERVSQIRKDGGKEGRKEGGERSHRRSTVCLSGLGADVVPVSAACTIGGMDIWPADQLIGVYWQCQQMSPARPRPSTRAEAFTAKVKSGAENKIIV